jgi:hypothetical protein
LFDRDAPASIAPAGTIVNLTLTPREILVEIAAFAVRAALR